MSICIRKLPVTLKFDKKTVIFDKDKKTKCFFSIFVEFDYGIFLSNSINNIRDTRWWN